MADETIHVEVAYASPDEQWLVALELPAGATAGEAVERSGILSSHPKLDTRSIGIFGEHVGHDRRLEDGDRVEIYRPLTADPREVRRELVKLGKTMKRR